MKALVIGCGYLGRRVADLWRAQGHDVLAMTRFAERAAAFERDGLKPLVADVLLPASLESIPPCDLVFYAVGFDAASGQTKRTVYVRGVQNVLEAVGDRVGRFLYVSSTSVYGLENGEQVDEETQCLPTTEEGRICLDAELQVREHFDRLAARRGNERRGIVLRYSGIYGPGRLLRRLESLRRGEAIGANPDAFLNLIHVADGARIAVAIAERGRGGSTYLVTDDEPVRRRHYYELLARLAGSQAPVFSSGAETSRQLNKRCSNARIRQEIGIVCQFPTFREGLAAVFAADAGPRAVN